jgi:hypothetical protein
MVGPAVGWLGLLSFLLTTSPAKAAGESGGDLLVKLRPQVSQRSLFLLADLPGNADRVGSAVLGADKMEGQQDVGYFATCYHVLHGTLGLKGLYRADGRAALANPAAAEYFPVAKNDLVLVRGTLAADHGLEPVLTVPPGPGQTIPTDVPFDGDVLAVGFPKLQQAVLHERWVRLGRAGDATTFGLADRATAGGFTVRPVFNEETAAGMSGGPVFAPPDGDKPEAKLRLAGIVVARTLDTVGFVIPADTLVKALGDADAPGVFVRHDGAKFDRWADPPYRADVLKSLQSGESGIDNALKWDVATQWRDLFAADVNFRERFQEVRINLPSLVGAGARGPAATGPAATGPAATGPIELRVEEASFAGEPGYVKVWVNRTPHNALPDQPGTHRIALDKLEPGENVIVVSRKSGREADPSRAGTGQASFRVDRLFRTVPVQVGLYVGGQRVYSVRRELPALFESFSTYLTLVKGTPAEAQPRGYNAHLAISLGGLSRLASDNPVEFTGTFRDALAASRVDVSVGPDADPGRPFVGVRRETDQAVRVAFNAQAAFTNFAAHYGGLTLRRVDPPATAPTTGPATAPATRPATAPTTVSVDARVQALRVAGGDYRLACRFVGGTIGEFPLPLGGGFEVDAGAAIAELLVAQLNNKTGGTPVHTESGPTLEKDLLRQLIDFARPGVLPAGVPVRLADVFVDPGGAGSDGWLVFTLVVGDVPRDDRGLKRVRPAVPAAAAAALGQPVSLAVLVTHGLPADTARQVVAAAAGPGANPRLVGATAKQLADATCQVTAAYRPPARPAAPIPLRAGDLTEWPPAMRKRLDEAVSFTGDFPLNAEALQKAVGGDLKDLVITDAKAGGQLVGRLDGTDPRWTGEKLNYTAGRIDRKGLALETVAVDTDRFEARPAGKGRPATLAASGKLSVGRVVKGDVRLTDLRGTFDARSDEKDPAVVVVTFRDLKARTEKIRLGKFLGREVEVGPQDVPADTAEVRFAGNKVTGQVTFRKAVAGVKLVAVLKFKDDGDSDFSIDVQR